jgi:hypothetical protein
MARSIDLVKRAQIKEMLKTNSSLREITSVLCCRPQMVVEIRKEIRETTITLGEQPTTILDEDFFIWVKQLNPDSFEAPLSAIIRNNQGINARKSHVEGYWELFQLYLKTIQNRSFMLTILEEIKEIKQTLTSARFISSSGSTIKLCPPPPAPKKKTGEELNYQDVMNEMNTLFTSGGPKLVHAERILHPKLDINKMKIGQPFDSSFKPPKP